MGVLETLAEQKFGIGRSLCLEQLAHVAGRNAVTRNDNIDREVKAAEIVDNIGFDPP
jgi:hypothetical protein